MVEPNWRATALNMLAAIGKEENDPIQVAEAFLRVAFEGGQKHLQVEAMRKVQARAQAAVETEVEAEEPELSPPQDEGFDFGEAHLEINVEQERLAAALAERIERGEEIHQQTRNAVASAPVHVRLGRAQAEWNREVLGRADGHERWQARGDQFAAARSSGEREASAIARAAMKDRGHE